MKVKFINQDLELLAKKILEDGLSIYLSIFRDEEANQFKNVRYFNFTDGASIGYVEFNDLVGLKYSTVHKPEAGSGSGFGISERDLSHAFNYRQAFFTPAWALNHSFTRYESITDWTKFQSQFCKVMNLKDCTIIN